MLTMSDGWEVRAMRWPGSGVGAILFINGRGDFIEKYAETLHDWQDQGFAVATFDWRGQGASGRLGKTPGHGHVRDFAVLKDDLAEIFAWFHEQLPGPYFAVAHSMGGHLLLRHLALHPDAVDRAVLLAPMIGISAPPFGPRIAGWLARFMVAIGRGQEWVFGAGPYGHDAEKRRTLLTSDAGRYADERWWVAQDPNLAIGGITWGWLKAALASVAMLRAVPTPLLVMMAEHEALVDNAATRRMFPDAETVQDAAHELLRERRDIRTRVVKRLKAYLLS
jgi:lysophospholipase